MYIKIGEHSVRYVFYPFNIVLIAPIIHPKHCSEFGVPDVRVFETGEGGSLDICVLARHFPRAILILISVLLWYRYLGRYLPSQNGVAMLYVKLTAHVRT